MALSNDIYKEFEDVVGPEYISDDRAVLDSYFKTPEKTPFIAVIFPKNTEEVHVIVKLCNKHKLPFQGNSTGWLALPAFIPSRATLYLDLRRMNRIIEINEKNMFAVVEPYVTSARLQAELMKWGLNCNINGAGANTTAVITAHGHMDQSTGGDDRNQLALEWVTPEGEIVGLGSAGSADEWFCGDGPGPSLRGATSARGPGIFTKAAVKIYHWPGPPRFPMEGVSPDYTLGEIPPGFMVRYYSFPSADKMYEAELKIGESEISFELMGFHISMVVCNITTSNEEEMKVWASMRHQVQGPGFMVIIAGDFPEDFEYKKRVLQQIISETGGKSLEPVEKDRRIEATLLFSCIRISNSIRETFRTGGAFKSIPVMGQRDLNLRWEVGAAKAKEALISKGLIVDDGAAFFGWGVEHGHLGKTEIFCRYDPHDPEAVKAVEAWINEQAHRAFDGCFFAPRKLPIGTVGPHMSNYHLWQRKFHKAFDPAAVG